MTRHGPRILLVTDHADEALSLWQSLTEARDADLQVDVVPRLLQALLHLRAVPVDAVVLDLSVPDSQGLDGLHAVQAAAGPTPVIVVARGATRALREAGLAAGAAEVYDQQDVNSGLVSHSVLHVMDRKRARLQHTRLQLLLQTVPEAVVIADALGTVCFANPAAQALFGHTEAAPVGELINFQAPLGEVAEVLVGQGLHPLPCEVRLAAIEWDGLDARLALVRPLDTHAEPGLPAAWPSVWPSVCPLRAAGEGRAARATRLKDTVLLAL